MGKIRNRLIAVAATVVGCISVGLTHSVDAATNITIDGDVSDWASVSKVSTDHGSEVAMVVDGDYLYYYVSANPKGVAPADDNGWGASPALNLGSAYNLKVGDKSYTLTPEAKINGSTSIPTSVGDKLALGVNVYGGNGSYNNTGDNEAYISAVAGTGTTTYNNVFEGRVALEDLQLSDTDTSFTLSGGSWNTGNYTVTATRTIDKTSETTSDSTGVSSASSSSTTNTPDNDGSIKNAGSGNNYTGSPNLKMDGSFDDWADITKTKIRESDDDYNVKEGALLQYDGNLYIYINMSPNKGAGYVQMQPSGYDLTIGGRKYTLTLEKADGSTYQQLSSDGQTEAVTMGIYDTIGSTWSATPKDASGYVTRMATSTGGSTNVLEVKIPLSNFAGANDDGQMITLQNNNLGRETMTVTGGSTGPVLLASAGFGIALIGVWQFNRRKKREEKTA